MDYCTPPERRLYITQQKQKDMMQTKNVENIISKILEASQGGPVKSKSLRLWRLQLTGPERWGLHEGKGVGLK